MTTNLPSAGAPPGPRTWVPGGNFLAFRRDPLAYFTAAARSHGDIAHLGFGPQRVYLVSHPDWIEDILLASARKFMKGAGLQRAKRLIGEGLLTSEGQMHLRQRRTIQPLFHRQQVQRFAETMVRHAARWRDSIADGQVLDVTDHMSHITLAIVGETLFSANVQEDADEVRDALTDVVQGFAYALLPGVELVERLPIPVFVRARRARERLDRVIMRLIAERRQQLGDHREGPSLERGTDLVTMLLAARDPENPAAAGMSDEQIRDEAMTIFLAGHETIATAMAWTWHLLAGAPSVAARLHDEIDRVAGGITPAADHVPKLEYARAVVAESMRLYPPAWTIGRKTLEAHTIGGYRIEPGALVMTSQWVVHRDPRWWPEPDVFRPERWLEAGSREARPKFAYFPFGRGTRQCIGESFAWTEAILLLATIAQRWRFEPVTPPTPEPRITLRPTGLSMAARAR